MAGWDKKPSTFVAVVRKNQDQRMRTAALLLLRQLIQNTPVDTGRLRSNWQVGIGEDPGTGVLDAVDEGTALSRQTQKVSASAVKGVRVIYVVNNVEYAEYVESGTDRMPAALTIPVSMLQVKRKLEESGPKEFGAITGAGS